MYHGRDNSMSAEVSELRDMRLGQVYDDACDLGFTLVSHKTGRAIVMVEDQTVQRDGDLLYRVYVPARKADRRVLSRVMIFND
jgi:hypothetical protein